MLKYLVVATVTVVTAIATVGPFTVGTPVASVTIGTPVTGDTQNCTSRVVDCKNSPTNSYKVLTTSAGAPIECSDATSTLNTDLTSNDFYMELITHFVRERIPERVVHTKGAGAFGYFQTTHDISHICKAKLFSKVGKKTPIAVRFSLTVGDKGTSDTVRDARGFAVKFYTEDGNLDIVGLSTPIFFSKDPLKFPSVQHALKQSPVTNYIDKNAYWDALSLNPESLYMFLLIFSDRGVPDGYRRMPGYSIHTYELVNERGESSFVRFHFNPEAGIKNLSVQEAAKIAAVDPDYATRDLYEAIARGEQPRWRVQVQILSMKDVLTAGSDVFDETKVLPLKRYPLHDVGWIVLNRNPINYFAEVEQAAYCPSNLVSGFKESPTTLFKARYMAYKDAQNYRLGINHNKIPVNCPLKGQVHTYLRDGVSPVDDNGGGGPNYFKNSYGGPQPVADDKPSSPPLRLHEEPPNNFEQAGELYANELTAQERDNVVAYIVKDLCYVEQCIRSRAIKQLTLIHPDLGNRIIKGLSSSVPKCV